MRRLQTDFFALPKPRVFAHRGVSGDYPENTMPAFQAALRLGAPYIELDIHMTRDGEVVVFHDPDLRRITGDAGLLKDRTLAGLQTLDAGRNFERDGSRPFRDAGLTIPSLQDVLTALPQELFVVEIKQTEPSLVPAMLALIEKTGMSRRVLIASEHQEPLDEVRKLAPQLPTNFSALEVAQFMAALKTGFQNYLPPGDALQIPPEHQGHPLATPEVIEAAHRYGIEVHVWTINDSAQIHDLLAIGVDGIMSDYPARLIDIIGNRSA